MRCRAICAYGMAIGPVVAGVRALYIVQHRADGRRIGLYAWRRYVCSIPEFRR